MKKIIDKENWIRKEHFDFFDSLENSFWGIAFELDCTKTYNEAKKLKTKFYYLYLHRILTAINKVEEFKVRVENDEIIQYDTIHISTTVLRPDGSFGFSFCEYNSDYEIFSTNIEEEIHRVIKTSGLNMTKETERNDTIHFSAVPWIHFTSLSHAQGFNFKDYVPKISVGKLITKNNRKMMPFSLHSNHALTDGFHAGKFVEELEKIF